MYKRDTSEDGHSFILFNKYVQNICSILASVLGKADTDLLWDLSSSSLEGDEYLQERKKSGVRNIG